MPQLTKGTTVGDIVYWDGTVYTRLPTGASGTALVSTGAGIAPSWGTAGCTLDQAYDFGGAHLGRTINVDNGFPVVLSGSNSVLQLGATSVTTATNPAIALSTGNGSLNFTGSATYQVQNGNFTSTARGYLLFVGARIHSQGNASSSIVMGLGADDGGGNHSIAIGQNAYSNIGIAMGTGARATASGSICFGVSSAGANSTASGAQSLVIAPGASSTASHSRSWIIGDSMNSTAADQMQIGCHDLIIGVGGDGIAIPTVGVYRGADAAGNNKNAANLYIRAGLATGSGTAGSLILQASPNAGGGGAGTHGTPTDAITIAGDGTITFGGTVVFSGAITANQPISFTNRFAIASPISPAQLTANVDNYAPTDITLANVIRQDVDATGRTITGLSGGATGRIIVLHNIATGAPNIITLTHEDGASSATNRFLLPGGTSLTIGPGASVMLIYDGHASTNRWRVAARV